MGLFSSKPTPAQWFGHIVENETSTYDAPETRAHQAYLVMQEHGLTQGQAAQAYQDYKAAGGQG